MNVDEMDLEEIEARLAELRDEKDAAEEFRALVGETADNLGAIQASEFVDESTGAKIGLLETMLNWIVHHDVHVEKRIHYDRERLRRRKIELERKAELEEVRQALQLLDAVEAGL